LLNSGVNPDILNPDKKKLNHFFVFILGTYTDNNKTIKMFQANAAKLAAGFSKMTHKEAEVLYLLGKNKDYYGVLHILKEDYGMSLDEMVSFAEASEICVPRPEYIPKKAKQNMRQIKVGDKIVKTEVICPLCGRTENGFGHNAYPLGDFRCCTGCNAHQVIPARINRLENENKKLKKRVTKLENRPHIIIQPEENRQKYEEELLKMCEEKEEPKQQPKQQKKKKEVKDRKPPKVVYINGVPVRLDALRK